MYMVTYRFKPSLGISRHYLKSIFFFKVKLKCLLKSAGLFIRAYNINNFVFYFTVEMVYSDS